MRDFLDMSALMQKVTISSDFIINYLKLSMFLQAKFHTRRFGLPVSSRRCPSSFYESYRMGGTSPSTSLMPQLVQAVIPPQHDAFEGINPLAGLSSIHSPTLGRV